ncbi:MAG: hypothetical protein KDC81_14545 [Flavobacteriaceae bacterium]|nr:hypothetical protein [Flavobacteriaceae bacterium]
MQNIIKISISLLVILFISSCNTKTANDSNTDEEIITIDSSKITAKDIAKLKYTDYALSNLTISKTTNWQKFNELTNKIELLKTGDLSFFRDDKAILESFITDLKNEVPESLKTPAISARLKVIETVFLKLEGLASLSSAKKEDLLIAIKDVLISYTNLVFQMNKKFEKESQNIEKPY